MNLPVIEQTRSAFSGPDAPREDDLTRCVHCGLCLMNCPTFVATGLETESPRGRIYLMRAAHEGRIDLTDAVLPHLELCLQCRNCESVCPSGVPYGRIMEATRAQIFQQRRGPAAPRILRTAVLRGLLPHRRRLALLAHALRAYQRSGLPALVRGPFVRRLLPRALRDLVVMAPSVADRFYDPATRETGAAPDTPDGHTQPPFPAAHAAQPTATYRVPGPRVAFFSGCVMPYLYGPTQEATVRVLARNGCRVVTPPAQRCCGALMVHAGDREGARALARQTIDLFLALDLEAIVVNAAGCGSTLKEYHELLEHDPRYAARARRFASLVRDATEFVVGLPFAQGLGRIEARVTYQDSCHLAHAQRIRQAPRQLIRAIPGVRLVEMPNADRCCGSAGIYNVVQREMSMQILDAKMEEVRAVAPDIIVTANPGCMLQLETGLRRMGQRARVMHVIDLLDLAYRTERASG